MFNLKDRNEDKMKKNGRRSRTTHKLLSAATILLLFLGTTNVLAQSAFEGNFNSVTISDAEGTNIPPNASFTYTQNGDSFTFDASGSSDTDGNITLYKWDFGDGTTINGDTATRTLSNETNHQITLSVIDDKGGVSLKQQTINIEDIASDTDAGNTINDTFDIDQLTEYTVISGAFVINDGKLFGVKWKDSRMYHNTPIGNDQFVEADVYYSSISHSAGILGRVNANNNTGYLANFSNGKIILSSISGKTRQWLASGKETYSPGSVYRVRLEANGDTIRVIVNETVALEKRDSTYPDGSHAGLFIVEDDTIDVIADNFMAGSL